MSLVIRLAKWIKSTFSGGNDGGDCVEVRIIGNYLYIRDTLKDQVEFDRKEWEAFLKGVKNGEFEWDVIQKGSNTHA